MGKYITINEDKKQRISTYINDKNKEIIEYLISILGNVDMSKEDLNVFVSQFSRIAGPYDVLTEPSTIKAMYNARTLYPELSAEAINCLFPRYIEDLFEEEKFIEKLGTFFDIFGRSDEKFETYLGYIDYKSKPLQEKYTNMIAAYDELRLGYSEKFIKYLENLTLRKHYDPQEVLKHIPTEEFVAKDEECLKELSSRHRIHFGVGYPISYKLVDASIKNKNLEQEYGELEYIVNIDGKCIKKQAGFNINDFNDSVKTKRLKLK